MRPWSAHLVLPSDAGRLWFKANGPHMVHEPALVRTLARLFPDRVREPVAVDSDRGWMLSVDEGPTLEAAGDVDLSTWLAIVTEAAALQRQVSGHGEAVVASGLPDLRAERLLVVLEGLVETLSALPERHPTHLDASSRELIDAARPWLSDAIDVLRGSPVPPSLQHGDLHPNNVFARREPGAPYRVFDFGDAQWAHPFELLVVPTRWLLHSHGASAVDAARAAYLQVFTDVASRAELEQLVAITARTHAIGRSLTWWGATAAMTAEESRDYGPAARAALMQLTDSRPS